MDDKKEKSQVAKVLFILTQLQNYWFNLT